MTDESTRLDEKQRTEIQLTEVSDIDANDSGPIKEQSPGGDLNKEPRHSFSAPDLSDDYEVLEFIGQGATGQVYKVRDKNLDRVLAVKVLRKEFLVDNQTVKRFHHEADAAAGLSHANVVSVYGHGEAKDGSPFITMNYIEGESLASILKKESKLEWQRALNLFIQICEGLEHAHANGLVHRDLKPSNIIVSKMDNGIELAHIVDFGIAKVVANRADTLNTLTASGDFLGTPTYMSPEQCLGQNIDHRTDFYALGCMLFEAVSGKSPFAGANTVEIIAKKMSEQSPILRSDTLPPEISIIVSCCMARNAQDRYESAQKLKTDLESVGQKKDPRYARLRFGMDRKLAGKRLLAFFIDNIIVSSAGGVFSFFIAIPIFIVIMIIAAAFKDAASEFISTAVIGVLYVLCPMVSLILYNSIFECKRGATPGKQMMGLHVCNLYGDKLSFKQAFLRNFSKMTLITVLPAIALSGFYIPLPGMGISTLIVAAGISYYLGSKSWTLHHQAPWDVWVKTQIRRR